MKKIRNMKQLREEKKRLHHREKELEGRMSKSWKQLIDTLRPEMIFNNTISEKTEGREKIDLNGYPILQAAISYGAGLVAGKLAKMAVEKLGRFIKI
jgi:hypothetical protein